MPGTLRACLCFSQCGQDSLLGLPVCASANAGRIVCFVGRTDCLAYKCVHQPVKAGQSALLTCLCVSQCGQDSLVEEGPAEEGCSSVHVGAVAQNHDGGYSHVHHVVRVAVKGAAPCQVGQVQVGLYT